MAKGEKKVIANVKMRIPAGRASAGPPVGSVLGQYGVNMMDFVNPFNEQTKDLQGQDVGVKVKIYDDRSFEFTVSAGPPADDLIRKAAGIDKGSGKPHEEKVAKITKSQVEEIAKVKMSDLNTDDLEQACKVIAGTARSMGVEVDWEK